ncbi:hypothetical protein [Bianquea renquensis]|uniref:Uncharacterized protein n=1 Tax=Bianquea renquensis TaxID=2763661 RepID=A0A926DVP6_9FIRM|nr:hypothetical protein [Bianquea renquensis]MBC8544946.1 hypothetical protein [Bianquea renquensis]
MKGKRVRQNERSPPNHSRRRSRKGESPPLKQERKADETKEGTAKMRGVRQAIRGGEVEKARVRR